MFSVWWEYKDNFKRKTGLNFCFNSVYLKLYIFIYIMILSECNTWFVLEKCHTHGSFQWWEWMKGDGKAEQKELEVFVCAALQEVCVLFWDRTNSVPSCFVRWKLWLTVYINKKGRKWNAQSLSSLLLINKKNCYRKDTYLWVAQFCQIRLISFKNLLYCYSFIHHTAPLSLILC